jgi:hypothetical protein
MLQETAQLHPDDDKRNVKFVGKTPTVATVIKQFERLSTYDLMP